MNINQLNPISFVWNDLPYEKLNGETGFSLIRTQTHGEIKIRQVEYSEHYLADHWCFKGHIVYVIQGTLQIEHKDAITHTLSAGMTYIIGDDTLQHKVKTDIGALILIID